MPSDRRPRLLVVDDDHAVIDLVIEMLQDRYDVEGVTDAAAALERVTASELDLVISDVQMPRLRGHELLEQIQLRKPGQLVLLMTAFGSIELAVQAVRGGACDFIAKPFTQKVLVLAVERALRERTMRREIVRLRRELDGDPWNPLVARSAAMCRVLDLAARAARSSATILLTGESGVGKGAVARWVHERSRRQAGPMLQINCAAIASNLVEAELFGVRKGASTDARESRDGLFVDAAGGTIFLDEIADLSLDAQAKLVGVLETSKVRPIGGAAELPVDARVIAATNRPIQPAINSGKFRLDLFYRLNVIPLEIPALRDRPEDIPDLVHALLSRASPSGARPIGIAESALRWMMRQEWPGNVRQLANVIERAVAITEHDTVVLEDIDISEHPVVGDGVERGLGIAAERNLPLEAVERAYIKRVIGSVAGNISRAARILRIDRRTLYRKLAGDR